MRYLFRSESILFYFIGSVILYESCLRRFVGALLIDKAYSSCCYMRFFLLLLLGLETYLGVELGRALVFIWIGSCSSSSD